jgi:protein-disulfide isomerase
MKLPFNAMTNGIVSACALTALGVLLSRGLPPRAAVAEAEPMVPEWPALIAGGHSIGPADAPAVLVTFSDFQCPSCGFLAGMIAELRAEQHAALRMVYRHLPLSTIHPHARPAALAAECAAGQNRFEAFHDALFAAQNEIGITAWQTFAARAGIPDLAAFAACLEDERHADTIDADVELADALGITATPTMFLNGRQLRDGLSPAGLRRSVAEAAQRKR